jgi:hypothetical protein
MRLIGPATWPKAVEQTIDIPRTAPQIIDSLIDVISGIVFTSLQVAIFARRPAEPPPAIMTSKFWCSFFCLLAVSSNCDGFVYKLCSAFSVSPLADNDAGSHRIARRHARHYGYVGDAQVFNSIDLEVGVPDRHGATSHLGRAALMPALFVLIAGIFVQRVHGALDNNPECSFGWFNNRRLLVWRYRRQPSKNRNYITESGCTLILLDFQLRAKRSTNRPGKPVNFVASH